MPTSPADASEHPDLPRIAALLREGDVDAAIEAGLMALSDERIANIDASDRTLLLDARRRLCTAWQARDRFIARRSRLDRIARERAEKRTPPAPAAKKPALPAAAANALARARAKASGSHDA